MEIMNRFSNICRSFCLVAAVILFIISIPILLSSFKHQKEIKEYLNNGLTREVNIIDCQKQNDYLFFNNSYEIKISYFTKPIFEGGEFKLHPILKHVNSKVFNEVSGLKKANIIYLKEKPEQSAILEASTKIENFSYYVRLDIGIVFLVAAIILFFIFKISFAENKYSS